MNVEPGNLLVVDDNQMNRDMLSRRLKQHNHTVAIAVNGRQALEMVRAEKFDLVLLDIMMPEVNGYEVLEQLKADETLRHIPVIMVSAVDELDSVVRCIEMGAEDYLPKPFNQVLLKARVNASLEKKRLRDQEQAHLRTIAEEKKRADDLLHVILPDTVVDELKTTNGVRPRRHENVAVMFCDIVEFTTYCDRRDPEEVMTHLQKLFELFEEMALKHDLEKIKTVGDAFMATAGLLTPAENPALNCVKCALDMLAATPTVLPQWKVRAGIHVGPVMAGVIGKRQYLFDVWGDTVNTAARIEGLGAPDTITLSGPAWAQVATLCHSSGSEIVRVKGKGEMGIYYVDGLLTG